MPEPAPLEVSEVNVDATTAIVTTISSHAESTAIADAMTLSIGRLVQFALRHGIEFGGPARALYHAFEEAQTTFTVAFPIAPLATIPTPTPYVRVEELPAIHGWRFVHRGAYTSLPATYERIAAWLVSHGVMVTREDWARRLQVCEEYVSDPSNETASEMVTHVYVSRARPT